MGFTRSRTYHKDDQAYVEQKNWMWPRTLLGYGRRERAELVEPISALYRAAWGLLQNCFLPGMKLQRQWREGSRWKGRYEPTRKANERPSGGDCHKLWSQVRRKPPWVEDS